MWEVKKPDLTEREIKEIVGKMTVDEKIDQMLLIGSLEDFEKAEDKSRFCFGFAFMPDGLSVSRINRVQKYIVEHSRFHIPLLVMGEGLHGVMHPRGTIFPQAIGLACSFNEKLMEEVAEVIGEQAKALGIRQLYAPNLDLGREPRWGRTEETYGEDPFLAARMGTAYVKGVQSQGVAATLKHYVAHGSPENGLNLSPVHLGERELRETMLEPFETCILEGGAKSVMPAYSEWDGIPVHCSRFLLRKVLREELGFCGTVVSDYFGIAMLNYLHKVAETAEDCAKLALEAGVDIEAPTPFAYNEEFRRAAKEGKIDGKLIDAAVENILRLKSELRLFSSPYTQEKEFETLDGKKAERLARQAGEEGVVLLKNEENLLPLKKGIRVAVVGVNAASAQVGDYSYRNSFDRSVSLRTAIEKKIGAKNVNYAKGCNIASTSEKEIERAVAAAEDSDAVIIALGDSSHYFGGIGWGDTDGTGAVTCGEGFDVSSLTLPPAQQKLFDEIRNTGKPMVLVLYTGRPYAVARECEAACAVLQAWYPGERGGDVVADILFGDVCPSGKLCVSFPRSTGHIPCYYNHKPAARGANYKTPGSYDSPGRDYVFDSPDALFSFGYGLSYTKFEYSALHIENSENWAKISLRVKNCGDRDGKESVLLFLSQDFCPVTPFVKKLRGFKKIFLKKGESRLVEFMLSEKDFIYIDETMKKEICRTKYIVRIGPLTGEFDLRKRTSNA